MPWINCSTDIASLADTGVGSRSRATTADKTYEFRMQHQGGRGVHVLLNEHFAAIFLAIAKPPQ